MITAEEILKPFIETPLRHTKIVSEENALKAMEIYAGENNGLKWVKASERLPEYNTQVIFKYKGEPKVGKYNSFHCLFERDRDLYRIEFCEWLDESGSSLSCIKCKEREKEVEGLKKENEELKARLHKLIDDTWD